MGTRGLWGFVLDDQEKFTYSHFDSYPEGLGADLLAWLRDQHDADAYRPPSDRLRERVRRLELVDTCVPPTEEQKARARAANTVDLRVSDRSEDDWYCLLRRAQGDPDRTLAVGMMSDDRHFATDSLFCEWAYVIDLDANVFEVYWGPQAEPHGEGRFAHLGVAASGYYPVKLLGSFPFDALPECLTDGWGGIVAGAMG